MDSEISFKIVVNYYVIEYMKTVTTYLVKKIVMKRLLPIVLFCLILISCQTNSNSKQKSEILKYQIAKIQDSSSMNVPKMVYRIMLYVDSLPTEFEMRNTATYLWENGNKNLEEFTVFLYLPYMSIESTAFRVAEFSKDGLVRYNKNDDALFGTKWETKVEKEGKEIKLTRINDGEIKEIADTRIKEYKIDLSAIDAGERKVKINITTNFPDGTNLSLWINRDYYVKGKNEPNGGELGSKDFFIKNGRFETIVIINDTEWYNRYQKIAKAIPDDFPPISKIPDKITINVMYTPAVPQPANVVEILGTRGEFVSGKGAEKFGTGTLGRLTSFHVSKELSFPMEGRVEKSLKYANYQSLKINETYAISKETPLMPEFEPSDPLAAMNNIKYLQAGSRIRILSIKDKYNFPWYEVQAMNKFGESVGEGWINSNALIGQDILVIK